MSVRKRTVNWQSAAVTHTGNVRPYNEDAHIDRSDMGVWAVADGMGGHTAGDVASQTVTRALGLLQPTDSLSDLVSACRTVLAEANAELFKDGLQRSAQIMGSTVVVMVASGTKGAFLWAGDSRGYAFRNGKLTQLTKDHSRINELIEHGVLTPEAAESHPEANVITRAIGVSETLDLDVVLFEIEEDDVFLLCSDGLTRYVSDSEIAEHLLRPSCQASVEALLSATLATSARDNVTAIMLRAEEAEHSPTVLNESRFGDREAPDDDPTLLDTSRD